MSRIWTAWLFAVAAILVAAPQAGADPQDLLPYCSGDQTPMDNNCRTMAHQEFTHDGTGTSPNLPSGLDPANEAVVSGG
jgi:hypothetical protein